MGREIRRVPADWEHPRQDCPHSPWQGGCSEARSRADKTCYHPLLDRIYAVAAAEWKAGYALWESGEDPDKSAHPDLEWWDWHGNPPDQKYYRPEWTSPATHYQVYETVSEGTPVTPHFATQAELIDYLVQHGDAWDRARGTGGWDRKAAEEFVQDAWAPSGILVDGVMYSPRDGNPLREPHGENS